MRSSLFGTLNELAPPRQLGIKLPAPELLGNSGAGGPFPLGRWPSREVVNFPDLGVKSPGGARGVKRGSPTALHQLLTYYNVMCVHLLYRFAMIVAFFVRVFGS